MDNILYIGGVGSSTSQAGAVARIFAAHFRTNAVGMSFSDACKNMALVARLASDSTVITHGAGMLIMKDISPKELIAVAPPMPVDPLYLLLRTIPKTVALLRSSGESRERWRKIRNYHGHTLREHVVRPHYNAVFTNAIGGFDAALLAVALTNRGVKATLGFMENDLLFPLSNGHPHVETAKNHGVEVHEHILGHHDEFLLYPVDVLAQLKAL